MPSRQISTRAFRTDSLGLCSKVGGGNRTPYPHTIQVLNGDCSSIETSALRRSAVIRRECKKHCGIEYHVSSLDIRSEILG